MEPNHLLWSLGLGVLASASLPLGSALGLALRPGPSVTALLAAFGAGALIAALAVELVAPTPEEVAEEMAQGGGGAAFFALVGGALTGGLLFAGFDRLLSARGGFLRKASTAIAYFTREQRHRHEAWLRDLCAIPLLRRLPTEQVSLLIRDVKHETFASGEQLFAEGEEADRLYFLREGRVSLRRGGQEVECLGSGAIFGELPLLAELPRTVTAVAETPAEALSLCREDFERWRGECPEFDRGLGEIASQRLAEIRRRDERMGEEERRWGQQAVAALRTGAVVPSHAQVRAAASEHEGSPLAVWLGLLLDGVPESLVIGAGFLAMLTAAAADGGTVSFGDVIPYTLVAGVFLSNFPEALSSSLGMRAQGWSAARVLGMWTLLLVLTALATMIGAGIGDRVPHEGLVAMEGIAAGAALTAVVATMIPEAVHLAGSGARVGLATLVGFLTAVSFKLLE